MYPEQEKQLPAAEQTPPAPEEEAKIDAAAEEILSRFLPAFEDLASSLLPIPGMPCRNTLL